MVSPVQPHGDRMRVRLDRDDDASAGGQEEALRGRERRALSGGVEVRRERRGVATSPGTRCLPCCWLGLLCLHGLFLFYLVTVLSCPGCESKKVCCVLRLSCSPHHQAHTFIAHTMCSHTSPYTRTYMFIRHAHCMCSYMLIQCVSRDLFVRERYDIMMASYEYVSKDASSVCIAGRNQQAEQPHMQYTHSGATSQYIL